MKKIFKIFAIFFIFFLLTISFFVFSRTINITNIKQLILSKLSSSTDTTSNITIVDITNLNSDMQIEHEHIFKTQYDENKHWEECKICNEKVTVTNHTYIHSWSMGSLNNCHNNNVLTKTCQCGYSYTTTEGRKQHNNTCYDHNSAYQGYNLCQDCTSYWDLHDCYKSDGSRITCLNLGKCAICNYTYNQGYHCNWYWIKPDETAKKFKEWYDTDQYNVGNKIYCNNCKSTYLAEATRAEFVQESSNIFKIYVTLTLPNGAVFSHYYPYHNFGNICNATNNISISGNVINDVITINFTKTCETAGFFTFAYNYTINGFTYNTCISKGFYVDSEKPKIKNITIENMNKWEKNKIITVAGTENYCNTVKIEILDDKGKRIYETHGNVVNQNYSISCSPEIESNSTGKTFTAIITDSCENSITQEFTISKIDSIAPEPTSQGKIEQNWAKSKNFTFKATDNGIGNVSIAFSDIKDLKLANYDGNEYSREYQFTGDVYSPKELSVLYKDELGNTSIQKITVDKLDNTSPTITNTSIHNNILTVEANDIKENLGEGSGVSKYRYITSTEKIENPEIPETATQVNSNENVIVENVSKVKYVYIVAEDAVRKYKQYL